MKSSVFVLALLTFCLTGCQTVFSQPTSLSLAEADRNGEKYRDALVKVCGYASNKFEDFKITEKLGDHYTKRGVILGVDWIRSEPQTDEPDNRCITGKLSPKGGWEYYELKSSDETRDVIVGGGSTGANWVIRQTRTSRD